MFDIIQRKIPENNVFGRNITKSGKLAGEVKLSRNFCSVIIILNNQILCNI